MLDHPPQTALRPASEVMRLARMGRMFPTRLSFLRRMVRDLPTEAGGYERLVWNIDSRGYGHAVYRVRIGGRDYALVAVSTHLADDLRTDRVIATAWDTSYVLYDGIPDEAEQARICAAAPKQEAARFSERDLVLSRANKSVRLFAHVVDRLRNGLQPDAELINQVGYLMRTTAVYGNGKFGISDRNAYADRDGLTGPFAAEMLAVWMIRNFTHDLAEHMGGARIAPHLKRQLGIGNSTGLGMAPFLVSHPVLLNNWFMVQETALARLRAIARLDPAKRAMLLGLADRAALHLAQWEVPDPEAQQEIETTRREWGAFAQDLPYALQSPTPLNTIWQSADRYSLQTQELIRAWMFEAFPDEIDGLGDCMADPFGCRAAPFKTVQEVETALTDQFSWALEMDFTPEDASAQFWYVSEEKLEPRVGLRHQEPGADRESPLDIARRVQKLAHDLCGYSDLAAFRSAHPEHEMALQRVLIAAHYPYSEIQDNLIAACCRPIDMLRCKLSFFGATKFDPKSDRWTRVTLAQGAPLPEDLGRADRDDWWLTVMTK